VDRERRLEAPAAEGRRGGARGAPPGTGPSGATPPPPGGWGVWRALRPRELPARPEVVAAFSLQAMALVAAVVLAAVAAEGLAGAGNDLILGGLRGTAAPGGLRGPSGRWRQSWPWRGGRSRACSGSPWPPCSRRAAASPPAGPGTTRRTRPPRPRRWPPPRSAAWRAG